MWFNNRALVFLILDNLLMVKSKNSPNVKKKRQLFWALRPRKQIETTGSNETTEKWKSSEWYRQKNAFCEGETVQPN